MEGDLNLPDFPWFHDCVSYNTYILYYFCLSIMDMVVLTWICVDDFHQKSVKRFFYGKKMVFLLVQLILLMFSSD